MICLLDGILKFIDYSTAYASYKKRIARVLQVQEIVVEKYYRELFDSGFFQGLKGASGASGRFGDFSMVSVLRAPAIYVMLRIVKPSTVIETGVCSGFSSSFILYALSQNKSGKLYSIDLPNQPGQEIAGGREVGWLVPDDLRKDWELIIGSSKEKLPTLVKELKKIDVFYHDSDHSYGNMLFEFNAVWDSIKPDGLLISDDITDNKAFRDFSRLVLGRSVTLFKLGVMRKV
jgi:hypothetical protein